MRRKALYGLAATAALAILALTAQAVLAHSRPIRFDPAPGAVLLAAPAKVDGWFTSPLRRDPDWNYLRVTDAQGNRVDTGEPILSADRRQITVNLRSGLGVGRYTVTWRAWDDSDGHILGDCYVFYVGEAAAQQGIADRVRIDGGGACQRIDVSAREGTPVAGGTPQATAASGDGHADGEEHGGDDSGGGVAVWVLMLGIAGGVAVGFIGSRLLSARA